MKTLILVDLSSIAYPIWHTSQSEPDPNITSTRIVARVRDLANGQPNVAICCDAGRSFRHEIEPSYKGQRPESQATLHHQIALACEALKADGYPVWAVRGFEADDVIASAAKLAIDTTDARVVIVSADKDILQLVGPRVCAKSVKDGSEVDEAGVIAKFGVRPDQMRDYLCLVGDASDNVKGAEGIGPKTAAELLARFGSVAALYDAIAKDGAALGLSKRVIASLADFAPVADTTRALIQLRSDVPLPFEEVIKERVAQPMAETELIDADTVDAEESTREATPEPRTTAIAKHEPQAVEPAPAEWERQLDPRSLRDAKSLALDMFASRMFSAYGTKEGVLSTIMVGRELGLPAMASLRSIHVVEGRHTLSASLMVALVLKSGLAEYFEPLEFDDLHATFETKRVGARNPVKLTYTVDMARTAGLVKPNSNWIKSPMPMCMARAQAMLCRLVYPDLIGALYSPDELEEIRDRAAA